MPTKTTPAATDLAAESETLSVSSSVVHTTIHAALVAALGEMPSVRKDNTAKVDTKGGGSYSYSYADLAAILDQVRPVLARHGLALTQHATNPERGQVEVATNLVWEGGETMPFGVLRMPSGDGPQGMGSAITYARRYSLLAALGVATEDDDGQAAQQAVTQRPRWDDTRVAEPPRRDYVAEVKAALDRAEIVGTDARLAIVRELAARNVKGAGDLTPVEAQKVLDGLAQVASLAGAPAPDPAPATEPSEHPEDDTLNYEHSA